MTESNGNRLTKIKKNKRMTALPQVAKTAFIKIKVKTNRQEIEFLVPSLDSHELNTENIFVYSRGVLPQVLDTYQRKQIWLDQIKFQCDSANKLIAERTPKSFSKLMLVCPDLLQYFLRDWYSVAKYKYPDGTNALKAFVGEHKKADLVSLLHSVTHL